MVADDKSGERIWAVTDRARKPPQRSSARRMRREPTEAERKMWWHLRHRFPLDDTHFRRQVQIGPYLADFACHKLKLVIEIDGGQHDLRVAEDAARTRFLESEGYRVVRFWNNDVLSNIDGVLSEILDVARTPTPDPSPQGGGEKKRPSRGG